MNEQIETKIAFLERANAELSEVVFRSSGRSRLCGRRLSDWPRIDAVQSDAGVRTPEEERPPHYEQQVFRHVPGLCATVKPRVCSGPSMSCR